jgi:hypothetical protein
VNLSPLVLIRAWRQLGGRRSSTVRSRPFFLFFFFLVLSPFCLS